jgi:hypothetical protein
MDRFVDIVKKYIEEVKFNLNQGYDGSTKQIVCSFCGHDKFYVGQGSYYTVVKCIKCQREECVHDG